jgi:predicted nuclease with TOPRIM domain
VDKKESYQEKWEVKFRILDAKVDELKEKADEEKTEAKIECAKSIEAIKAKQKEVKEKIQEMKTAGGKVKEDLKAGVDNALYDLKKAIDSAVIRFR